MLRRRKKDVTPVLAVHYLHEPDVVCEFARDGDRIVFGRGDDCDLVIWTAINGTALSRHAGAIWRMEGELWLRNLSHQHDLWITVPGRPPLAPLPPREDDADPGAAQSIPGELAYVNGPDGCVLVVTQSRASADDAPADEGSRTVGMPPLPDRLRRVATALCEPLLAGGRLPASYDEVLRRLDDGTTRRKVRDLVAELCTLYVSEVPELRARVEERQALEARELALPSPSVVKNGIRVFAPVEADEEDADTRRRRSLALPDYFEVAHLLVRRRAVTQQDVERLLGDER